MGEAGGGGLRGGETTESSSALAWNSPGLRAGSLGWVGGTQIIRPC